MYACASVCVCFGGVNVRMRQQMTKKKGIGSTCVAQSKSPGRFVEGAAVSWGVSDERKKGSWLRGWGVCLVGGWEWGSGGCKGMRM